jgi:NADPH-dependent 2,4-dienoyl-CoA reductase/sulfur reductase-like enzyme/nitrite reductase/ring-hydroxylating ferredoxin subunit
MDDSKWKKMADIDDLPEGKPLNRKIGKKELLVVRRGDRVCACGNKCTHYGAPLSDGVLRAGEIICPFHGARFSVDNGRMAAAPALDDIPSYEVKVEKGEVFIGSVKERELTKPSGRDSRTFVVLGAGAAGNAAAETLRREEFAGRVVLITSEPDIPYDRPNLSKGFLSGEDPPEWLPLRSGEFYETAEIELMTGKRVEKLELRDRSVIFSDDESLKYDKLLLATGGKPRLLGIPGITIPGSFLLRSRADALRIREAAEEAGRAVVIGASFIGLEVAASLRKRGIEVTVIAPEPVPLPVFGERIGKRIQRLHAEKGVQFQLGKTPAEIIGSEKGGNDAVREVVLSDGNRLPADLVVTGVGIAPAVELLEGTGLIHNGALPVNGRLPTEAEHVFAAGDIASVPDLRSSGRIRVEHWIVAERQGQHAARAMMGGETAYDEVPIFWTKQYDASLKYAGFVRGYDRIDYRGDVETGAFLAGYYVRDALRAVATLGMGGDFLRLTELIRAGVEVPTGAFEERGDDWLDSLWRSIEP